MSENSAVRAPYNFVPFSSKRPLLRYSSAEQLPAHDIIDPELKTGEILVKLEADTPVFISDGKKESPHFFRDGNGNFAIPGSTIRGMVRENMTVLGFGLMRPGENFENRQIFFREMSAARGSTGGPLKEYYRGALGIESRRSSSGKTYSIPENVEAGYLCQKNGDYFIRPVRGHYLRVSRNHPDVQALGKEHARTVQVAYTVSGDNVRKVQKSSAPVNGMESGTLLSTGKWVGRIPNHLYIFPLPDEEAEPVSISEEDRLSYEADWEDRYNSLKAYYNPDFWKLPEAGTEKPVFYIQHQGHVYFGMSLFLRIGYQHALSEGLPKVHREILEADPCALDYVYAVLGFAQKEKSYRSRVSFEDCVLKGTAQEKPPFKAVLGQPKPSYYPGYVKGGRHYGEEGFQLRGSKQYWLKQPEEPEVLKENVAAELRPLAEGSVFEGTVHYRNLTEDELGLLLWSLRLDEGCYQSIGMGKPYGYGRMKLEITGLKEFDPEQMYTPDGLCAALKSADAADTVEQYINAYDAYASERLYVTKPTGDPSLRSLPVIKEFFFIRSTIMENADVSYMALDEYKNLRYALPSVDDYQKQEENKKKEKEISAPTGLEALVAKFNHH